MSPLEIVQLGAIGHLHSPRLLHGNIVLEEPSLRILHHLRPRLLLNATSRIEMMHISGFGCSV